MWRSSACDSSPRSRRLRSSGRGCSGGLIAVLAVFMVLRPMVTRLTMLPQGLLSDGRSSTALTEMAAGSALAMSAGQSPVPLLQDESMVNLAQIEGQMRASSLRRISDLADKHPEETLSIMRGWIAQEAG
jgi:flagellar M-ring protein FliF